MYAVKVIHRGNIDQTILYRELAVLRVLKDKVRDDNIIRIVDLYEDVHFIHIVMEYLGGGDLHNRLVQKRSFSGKFIDDL